MYKLKIIPALIISAFVCLLLTNCAATSQVPGQSKQDLEKSIGGSDSGKKAAEALLNSMNLENALKESVDKLIQVQLEQNPAMLPYRNVMLEFYSKHMSYESMKADMIQIYADAFNEKELKEIARFYKTATGQKTIEKMPELMSKGAQLGISRVKENLSELKMMVQKESERIQQLQKK